MFSEDFSSTPMPAKTGQLREPRAAEPQLRRMHRWVSMIFTLAVAANFTAMIWGSPPAWITYSPLPPLLLLSLTGLYMLVRHLGRSRRTRRAL